MKTVFVGELEFLFWVLNKTTFQCQCDSSGNTNKIALWHLVKLSVLFSCEIDAVLNYGASSCAINVSDLLRQLPGSIQRKKRKKKKGERESSQEDLGNPPTGAWESPWKPFNLFSFKTRTNLVALTCYEHKGLLLYSQSGIAVACTVCCSLRTHGSSHPVFLCMGLWSYAHGR